VADLRTLVASFAWGVRQGIRLLLRQAGRVQAALQRHAADAVRRRLVAAGILFILAAALQAQVVIAAESNVRQTVKEREAVHIAAASRGGQSTPEDPARKVSREELILMARVIEGEASGEPYLGKVAVGAVIVNRLEDPRFPETVPGVVYQANAFEAVDTGQIHRPLTAESIRAAEEALRGHDPTGGAVYYWNPYKKVNPWVWSRRVHMQIGNHVFAR